MTKNGGILGNNKPLAPTNNVPASPPVQNVNYDQLKEKLESFKKAIVKKYSFTMALSLLPMPAYPIFEEDEAVPKEVIDSKPIYTVMIIPEEQYKNIAKIKAEVVKLVKESKENLWVYIKTPVDLWNYGLDSKFEMIDAVATSFPLYDKSFLGAFRVANIHKSLVIRRFEKYVASYVIGGSLVRGTASKDSDVDTIVVIDDTDVKRMSRIELLERLRSIIVNDLIREATALSGVKNVLNVQVYLLTDFWQSVKDAHPVMFTFIRDGIPFYDRGTFLPWKLLLKMGKIKPSPEAVDVFMKSSDQTDTLVKRRMIDAMVDIYWGIVTPTQALVMLAGEGPEVPKNLAAQVERLLVNKEKLMDNKTLKILEKIIKHYKDYEHGKLNEFSGKEVDTLMIEFKEYSKKMKELRSKLEKRMQEHTADKVYSDVFALLKELFGNKPESFLIKELDKELVKKGKIHPRMIGIVKQVSKIKETAKKTSPGEMQKITGDAIELVESLIEYSQRKDLVKVEKNIMQIAYSGRKAELVLTDHGVFIGEANSLRKLQGDKLVEAKKEELEKALKETKSKLNYNIHSNILESLKKALGEFQLVL